MKGPAAAWRGQARASVEHLEGPEADVQRVSGQSEFRILSNRRACAKHVVGYLEVDGELDLLEAFRTVATAQWNMHTMRSSILIHIKRLAAVRHRGLVFVSNV